MNAPLRRDADFVKAVNRLYHEAEAAIYDRSHPEIFGGERKRWRELAARFLARRGTVRILDLGSGTGFVAQVLGDCLDPQSTVVLCDISPAMLQEAKRKLIGRLHPRLEFCVADAETLPFPSASFDAVTLNSVLHHLPNTATFLGEARRVIKPGGLLLVAHEPNGAFYRNGVLRSLAGLLGWCYRLGHYLRRLRQRVNQLPSAPDPYVAVYERVNQTLRDQGLIASDLAPAEIQSCVDVHSPTASGVPDPAEGFLPLELAKAHFPGWSLRHFETAAHLGKLSDRAGYLLLLIEKALRTLFPRSGLSFTLVLERPRGSGDGNAAFR